MARYFWCAFSANARYASEDLQNHLLELICITHGKTWHKDAVYQHIWREQYAEVIHDYCASIETITNRWLASPAGRLFRETCAKSRQTQNNPNSLQGQTCGVNGVEPPKKAVFPSFNFDKFCLMQVGLTRCSFLTC